MANTAQPPEQTTRSEFVFVNGVPTYLVKYGAADLTTTNSDSLILVIPGNPGIIGFYEEFMEVLHQLSGRGVPVWGVSHAGHVTVPAHIDNTCNPTQKYYNLDEQIRHKLDFIRQYIPSCTRIVIVSHSIGCHMALKLIERINEENLPINIEKSIMLFPTIKHMVDTPHGKLAAPLLKYFKWLAYLLVLMLSYLSPVLQYRLVLWYFAGRRVSECAYNASLNLFDPRCTYNCMFLTEHEFRQVLEPDYELINRHLSKFIFYYGKKDHWAPLNYYADIKGLFPEGEIYLCQRNFEHAFVLGNSREMAHTVWTWTQKALNLP